MKTSLWNELLSKPDEDFHEKEDSKVMEFMIHSGLDPNDLSGQFKDKTKGAVFMVTNHPTHCCILIYAKCERLKDTGYICSCLSKKRHSPVEAMVAIARITSYFAENCTTVSLGMVPVNGASKN